MIPRWIAFEGGEGCGKSTQARLLAERLAAVLTREPGGTAVGEQIRGIVLASDEVTLDPRTEALLVAADRAEHVAEVVRPALAAGQHVVSDRSVWSSIAYQGAGRGLDSGQLLEINSWATDGLFPDVVVLLEVAVDVAQARRGDPRDRMEAAGADFHERVRAAFAELSQRDDWETVDGHGDLDEVAARVWAAVERRLV